MIFDVENGLKCIIIFGQYNNLLYKKECLNIDTDTKKEE